MLQENYLRIASSIILHKLTVLKKEKVIFYVQLNLGFVA